jgi:tRNA pseudouridine38-40 synthase
MPAQRYKLTLAYRGTRYHGWQHQVTPPTWKGEAPPEGQGIPTIQETLRRAIERVLNHPITLVGSSRTDAGVHAKGQVAHFDTDRTQIPLDGLRRGINHFLPADVLVRSITPVPPEFDAIKSTLSKRYQYFIWNHEDRPLFFPDLAWHRWQKLNIPAMQQAATHFVGTHDFASFARPGHGREHTVRTVLACDLHLRPPRLIVGVEGTGFLWHMVRILVGTLVEVGLGKYPPDKIRDMIEAKDRKSSGSTAPAHGLYLQWIKSNDVGPRPTPDIAEVGAPLSAAKCHPERSEGSG